MNTSAPPTRSALLLPDEAQEIASLLSQVAWFNRLRLVVAAAVIWLCALATHALELVSDPWPLYLLGAAIVLVDGLYILGFSRLQRSSLASVRRHVYLQIAVDLAILTALLHFSGGITTYVPSSPGRISVIRVSRSSALSRSGPSTTSCQSRT